MLADQYLLEATEAMEPGERLKAGRAGEKIEALNSEPPPMFAYCYGKLLAEHGVGPEVWRKGQALLKQFVLRAGRDSEYSTPTLKLLSRVDAKLEAAARRAPWLRKMHAQLVRIEGGRFPRGGTPEQEPCPGDEKPAHQVRVSSFEVSTYEVTPGAMGSRDGGERITARLQGKPPL